MAALSQLINHPDIPPAYRLRYSTALPGTSIIPFVQWANDLLEELQDRGFLPSLKKERGVVVQNDIWIPKPADLLKALAIYNPEDERAEYRFTDIEGKLKLSDVIVRDYEAEDDSSSFSDYAVGSIVCADLVDTTKYVEDYFKNYLFYITAGTSSGIGIVLSGNDAANAITGTKLYFLHNLASALSGTRVTAADLIEPNSYLMLRYEGTVDQVLAIGDEFPIENDCENRLVPAWLRWKCERAIMSTSKETIYWEGQVENILLSIQSRKLGRIGAPSKGRRLVGFERSIALSKPHPDYSEFT